jgi:ubiquinone/menaquinone biosynthesis C-methylase UbiE
MPAGSWLLVLVAAIAVAALLYWLLILTEGAYLGSKVVAELYNRFARRYDAIKQFDDVDEAYFLGRPVARYLAGQPAWLDNPPWVLDVAAGTGRFPLAVLHAGGTCRVVALDNAPGMLDQAQRKLVEQGWRNVVYLAHDARRLPFAAGQFAVVSCLEALEFMPDPDAALVELLRVAAPGALVVLTNRIGREARLMPGRIFSRDRLSDNLRSLDASSVEIIPWQMDYDLVFALKRGQAPAPTTSDWTDMVRCPDCGGRVMNAADDGQALLVCGACAWRLVQRNGLWRQS